MDLLVIILLIVIIIGIIGIGYAHIYNIFQVSIIRINESEAFIDTTLRKRFDLLNKSVNIIKAHTDEKKEVLKSISELRSQKLSNFDLDRKLYDAINEFNKYKEEIEELKESDEFIKIDLGLFESEAEIVAARKYYNDIITEYNRLVRSFPSNLVAKLSNYKERPYFDGKNMNDEIINDFKL